MPDDRSRVEVASQIAVAGTFTRTTVDVPTQQENSLYFRDVAATAAWAATTVFAHGDKVKPTAPNGFVYRVKTPGTSAGSAPTWPTTIGTTVTDGTVVWICYVKEAVAWVTTTAKVVGDRVRKTVSNGHGYVCIVAGTTGASEPTWPLDTRVTVVDGTVTWREDGPELGY